MNAVYFIFHQTKVDSFRPFYGSILKTYIEQPYLRRDILKVVPFPSSDQFTHIRPW